MGGITSQRDYTDLYVLTGIFDGFQAVEAHPCLEFVEMLYSIVFSI